MVASAGISLLSPKSSAAHFHLISTPANKYAFERAMRNSRAGLKRIVVPNISVSGVKLMLVPRLFGAAPIDSREDNVLPLLNC